MSVAATQRASPKRNTAQSSPMGTTSSGGGAGRRLERRPMRSNSFTQSSPKGPWRTKNLWPLQSIPLPSRLHLPYGGPQNVRFFPGVPGIQATPLLLGDPRIGVVGGAFEADLAARVAGEKTDPCVELGIVGRAPGLDPGPPYNLRLDIEVGLFEGLAPRAKGEVLARLEHAARVFPEPHRWLAAPQQEHPGLVVPQVYNDRPGAQGREDDAGTGRGGRRRLGERSFGEGSYGSRDAQDVLAA